MLYGEKQFFILRDGSGTVQCLNSTFLPLHLLLLPKLQIQLVSLIPKYFFLEVLNI